MHARLTLRRRRHAAAEFERGGSAGPAPVLDPQALERLAELDPSGQAKLVERVLQAFQSSAARLRPQADAARAAGDRGALRLVVHTLKSSSASIGAMALSELCARIETAIRQEPDAAIERWFDPLNSSLDATLAAIAHVQEQRA
jgi:HPt (histidine-containing phosphotransfer) domain-containing protein